MGTLIVSISDGVLRVALTLLSATPAEYGRAV